MSLSNQVFDMTTRRNFIKKSMGFLLTGTSLTMTSCVKPEKVNTTGPRKNVLMIVVEDLKTVLGCYGNPIVQTPNLDRLAKRGMRFTHAYCQFPVCNPSRSSLLSGLRPDTVGILDNKVSFQSVLPNVVTLPQLFRNAGYYTAGLGKVFHGQGEHQDPDAWDYWIDPKGTEKGKKGVGRNLTDGKVEWCRWLAADGDDNDQTDGLIAQKAIEILSEKRDNPFFLTVGFHKPHDPFIAPKEYFDLYPLDSLELPKEPKDSTPTHKLSFGSSWEKEFNKFDEQDKKEFLRSYYAGVTFSDRQIGKVLDCLEEQGLEDDTIILFFGDHGYHLGDHGWWNKNTLYEHSCLTPMIMVSPGETKKAVVCDQLVELLDIFPTLADLCKLEPPKGLEGKSFKKLLSDPEITIKKAAYSQVLRGKIMGRTVRTKRWRYIEWDNGRQGIELYDHENDPGEFYNLAKEKKYESIIKDLKKLLNNPA